MSPRSVLQKSLFPVLCLLISSWVAAAPASSVKVVKTADDVAIGKQCVSCHKDDNPGLVSEWAKSAHAKQKVDCYDCHKAKEGTPGAYAHQKYKDKPIFINTVVSPKQCAACHEKEVAQHQPSHHAKGGQILASLDNIMGEVIGGPAAVNAGCLQCHGGTVKVDEKGRPTPLTWPDTGIGRLNLDGSLGSLPYPSPLLLGAGTATAGLCQVPPRPGSSAEGSLRRVQARHRLCLEQGRDEP